MRRLLYFVACSAIGVGILLILSSGTGAGTPFGIAFCVLMVLCGLAGWRARGPLGRELPASALTRIGLAVVLGCALMGVLLLWRPAMGEGLPMWPFLICLTVGGVLIAVVGRMGQGADRPN